MILLINNNNTSIRKRTQQIIDFLESSQIQFMVLTNLDKIDEIDLHSIRGIILSGSSLNLTKPIDIQLVSNNIALLLRCENIPMLGICFGFQMMCMSFGGRIEHMQKENNKIENTNVTVLSPLFKGLPTLFKVCSYHGDKITYVPKTFEVICKSDDGIIQGIQNLSKKIFGLQFHPESNKKTRKILLNFLEMCEIVIN